MRIKQKCLLLAAALLLVSLWCNVSLAEEKVGKSVVNTVTPEQFGAYPSDGEDDTEALKKALATGAVVQLSKGTYQVSSTLDLKDQTLVGAGISATVIESTCKDKKQPVLRLSGRCTVTDMSLQFAEKSMDYTEKMGERVALWLGKDKPADGSQLRHLRFLNCGTAVYAPNVTNGGVSRLLADTLYVSTYSYRAVDFRKAGQYGNTFSNLYIGSRDNLSHSRNAGFAVEGGEYNLVIEQLNLEHYYYDSALLLKNCYGARIGSIHMEANGMGKVNSGAIRIENSDVFIDNVTEYYNPIDKKGCSILQLGNAGSKLGNRVEIGTIHLKGMNNVSAGNSITGTGQYRGLRTNEGRDFKMVDRVSGATGTYEVNVDNYVYYTWSSDADMYAALPFSETGIRYVSKGSH